MTDLRCVHDAAEAERVIESLRFGIPPSGHLRDFTVGRAAEVARLEASLHKADHARGDALLVEANYGAGKTHLLCLVRELALAAGYAVALVTVDARSGVRFNRTDQVAAAVMREVEMPGDPGKGVWRLFDAFAKLDSEALTGERAALHGRITSNGTWGFSEVLQSPGLWVAMRAWVCAADPAVKDLARDWLSAPWEYDTTPGMLARELVTALAPKIRDPRSEPSLARDNVFKLRAAGHVQAWATMVDINTLARVCGFRGLILLFDEFEDVIQNMNNIKLEQDAFVNLFRFFAGDRFPGMSYFAVTPEFAVKCRNRLLERFVYDFPTEEFDTLARFRMEPISREQFAELARKVRVVHGAAYEWDAVNGVPDRELDEVVLELFARPSADQIRQAIEGLVAALDERLEQ